MFDKIDSWIYNTTSDSLLRSLLTFAVDVVLIFLISGIAYCILKFVGSAINKRVQNSAKTICTLCIKHKIIAKVSAFIFFFLILAFSFRNPKFETTINKLAMLMLIVMTINIINTVLDVILEFYTTKSISKSRPIKGPIQIVKIGIMLVLIIVAISILINQNPIVLISGFGAFTAILSLIFKDAIVGLVAGIQITSENLLEIGDWVCIPSENIEGTVIDISLITIRLQTFSNTIANIPAHTFVTSTFTNSHTTVSDKKRQVARTIYVDASTIRMENGGTSTNLTRYRQALADRINESEHVRKEFSMLVRTGNSKDGFGLPVEVIYTTDIVDYDEYTAYCSYVSDLCYGLLDKFDLKPFQPVSSSKH